MAILLNLVCVITHIYREGNKIADGLANEAVDRGCNRVYATYRELPKKIKGSFLLDKDDIPNIRI